MHFLLILIMVFIVGVFMFLKLRKSKFVDKLTHELLNDETKPDEVIKDISKAEKALQAKADEDKVKAEQLEKESAKIGDYLASKGVVKTDKAEEGEQSEK